MGTDLYLFFSLEIRNMVNRTTPKAGARPSAKPRRTRLSLETLDSRDLPSATAFFNAGTLTVIGDDLANQITVAATRAGDLTVTDGSASVPIITFPGQVANKANLTSVNVFGRAGDDTIVLDGTLNTGTSGPVGFFAPTATDDMYRWRAGTLTDIWDGGAGNDSVLILGNGNGASDNFVLSPGKNGTALFQRVNLVQFSVRIDNTETIVLQPDTDNNNGGGNDIVTIGDLTDVRALTRVVVNGGAGNDNISAGKQMNRAISMVFNGEASNDTILGGYGKDTLTGGAGNDVVTGGGVAPALDGSNDSVLDGGDGNDQLISGFGNDTITGGSGDDTYVWKPGTINDFFDGGAGFDISTIIGNDTFQGAPAGDAFTVTGLANGHVRVDRINLVPFFVDHNNTEYVQIQTGAGNDAVTIGNLNTVTSLQYVIADGGSGNDTLDGSAQAATTNYMYLYGNDGDDTLIGGSNFSFLADYSGNNTILGGSGGEYIEVGGSGFNVVSMGGGNDYVYAFTSGNLFVFGGDGNDIIDDYGTGTTFIDGGAGDDYIYRGYATGGSTIFGGDGNDTIFGGQGADNINGGVGNDMIYGSDPAVNKNGDGAIDTLTGGSGKDTFYLFGADISDLITDFNPLEDTIIVL
jgi:Ca2+-binding RTX toxin-like protein